MRGISATRFYVEQWRDTDEWRLEGFACVCFCEWLVLETFSVVLTQRFNFTNISVAFVTAGKDYFNLTTIPRTYTHRYKIFNFTTFPWVTPVFRMYSQIIIGSQIQSAVTTKSSAPVIFSKATASGSISPPTCTLSLT